MKKCLMFVFVFFGCLIILTSCAPQKYVHNDPTFSFDLVPGYTREKPVGDKEVVRFAAPNQYKIPVYAAAVLDKPDGLKLSESSEVITTLLEKTNPGSSRFQVISQKAAKLGDGSDAQVIHLKWKWVDTVTLLKSVFVVTYKENKLIYLSGTTIFAGGASYDDLEKVCMTLQQK